MGMQERSVGPVEGRKGEERKRGGKRSHLRWTALTPISHAARYAIDQLCKKEGRNPRTGGGCDTGVFYVKKRPNTGSKRR